jgi:hypothetical protein
MLANERTGAGHGARAAASASPCFSVSFLSLQARGRRGLVRLSVSLPPLAAVTMDLCTKASADVQGAAIMTPVGEPSEALNA